MLILSGSRHSKRTLDNISQVIDMLVPKYHSLKQKVSENTNVDYRSTNKGFREL